MATARTIDDLSSAGVAQDADAHTSFALHSYATVARAADRIRAAPVLGTDHAGQVSCRRIVKRDNSCVGPPAEAGRT